MNIVQVIPSFNVGGGELLAVRLCAEIKKQRPDYKVTLISLYDPIPSIVYDEALASGAQIVTLGKKKGFDPFTPLRMLKALRAIKPDVIHTHLAGLRYSMPASLVNKKAIKMHTVHNMASYETSPFMKHVQNFAFKQLGWRPIALSESVQKSIHDVYGLMAPIVNNGISIDNKLLGTKIRKLDEKCNIPKREYNIITIGRLWAQKNHKLLIDAFDNLCKQISECNLLIVGEDPTDGNYRKKLENIIENLPENTRSKIFLLGTRKDIPELLLASDVFVLSSDWEGVPLTLLEAMGYGIPTVCTSVGGIPDVIEHGVDGLLVAKGDVDGLANTIADVLIDKSLATTLASNAKTKFYKSYSIETTASKYLDLYDGDCNDAKSI